MSLAGPGSAPKGPDSFILTYNYFETQAHRELVSPYHVGAPPTVGNPGSTTVCHMDLKLIKDIMLPITY